MSLNNKNRLIYKEQDKWRINIGHLMCYIMIIAIYNISHIFLFGMQEFTYDTAIQIKAGQDIIETGKLITGDTYSWHEGLNWVPHEQLWYILMGFAYNTGGIIGVALVCSTISIIAYTILVRFVLTQYNANPIILGIVIFTLFEAGLGFPSSAPRPQIMSGLLTALIITAILNHRKKMIFIFPIITWLTMLFHGGTIKVPFMVYGLYLVIELIMDKKIKPLLIGLGTLVIGFGTSLLAPRAIECWMYQSNSEKYPELLSCIGEWLPMSGDVIGTFLIIVTFIGMTLDKRFKNLDKNWLFLCALIGLFTLGGQIYCRMYRYLVPVLIITLPLAIENIWNWVNDSILNTEKIKKIISLLGKCIKPLQIIVIAVAIVLGSLRVVNSTKHFDENTVNGAATAVGYDVGVIDFIKEKQYKKIINDYGLGTWLAFNDIKVHIDDRFDPFIKSQSGEDHIHHSISIDSITWLDDMYDRYHMDAIVYYYATQGEKDDIMPSGEVYKHSNVEENFLNELIAFRSDRYKIVYDNTTEDSTNPIRWVVIECIE